MNTPFNHIERALSLKYHSTKIISSLGRTTPYGDIEVPNGKKIAFQRIFSNLKVVDNATKMFGKCISRWDHNAYVLWDQQKDVHALCYLRKQDYSFFQPLVIKILSQTSIFYALPLFFIFYFQVGIDCSPI